MNHTFSIQALIFLTAAVFVVPLCKKLGFGSVLGYLVAGILIGPFALGWVGGNQGDDIMHFAEIGVVMMMFIIGLGVEPKVLWSLKKFIMGLGVLQVVGTAALFTLGLYYFFHFGFKQSLAIGLIFSLSSTAIVMQTMTENKWLRTDAGKNSFSVLLFQDMAVIPILALLPLLGDPNLASANGSAKAAFLSDLQPVLRTLVVLASVAVIVIGGRYLTRPIFKMVASTNMEELFNAVALLIVFTITVLMSLVGLSPALGAFLAGVVLATSEYKHELQVSIDPFKGLFLGLFFVAVGVSINFSLIAEHPGLIITAVLGVMLAKLAILAVLGRTFGMSKKQSLLFAFALAQVGEFGFVLLTFGKNQRIFDTESFNLLMVIVAASMAMSPIFMLCFEKIIIRRFFKNKDQIRSKDYDSDGIRTSEAVIIAGYGRFGRTVGRFLRANGIVATVLDSDSDRVDLLRKIGVEVYYGDALRVDLLKKAGAETAKIIVIALDQSTHSVRMVKIVKKHFPHLHIVVRSRDLDDTYDLMEEGILHIYREAFDSSMHAGRDVLKMLGMDHRAADAASRSFSRHDAEALKKLAIFRRDKEQYMKLLRSRNEQLELLMRQDIEGVKGKTENTSELGEERI